MKRLVPGIKKLLRADKKFSLALGALLVLFAISPLISWYVKTNFTPAPSGMAAALAPAPSARVTPVAGQTEGEAAPADRGMPQLLAASLFTVFYEKQNALLVDVCKSAGVPMVKYPAAMAKAYATTIATVNQILGAKAVYFETYLNIGGKETGISRVEHELDQKALSKAKSRADICRGLEAAPEKAVADMHFAIVQPQSFKALDTAAADRATKPR